MDIVRICRKSRQGSIATQKNRKTGLVAIAGTLKHLGYSPKSARGIKPKMVDALIDYWQREEICDATIRNRMAWMRWLAEETGRANIIKRGNGEYGVARRQHPRRDKQGTDP